MACRQACYLSEKQAWSFLRKSGLVGKSINNEKIDLKITERSSDALVHVFVVQVRKKRFVHNEVGLWKNHHSFQKDVQHDLKIEFKKIDRKTGLGNLYQSQRQAVLIPS